MFLEIAKKLKKDLRMAFYGLIYPTVIAPIDKKIDEKFAKINKQMDQLHYHIDTAQRDILIAMSLSDSFIRPHNIILKTEHPVAIKSPDHLYPKGTKNDNTRCPRFIKKCLSLFPYEDVKFLDLGCSGGGVVFDATLNGLLAIGMDGSDFSLINQRAEWRLLKNNLFTCDISQSFELFDTGENTTAKFDIISAMEVVEHLPEESIDLFLANIKKHLSPNGYFVASIALNHDINPETGIDWHLTVKPEEWWLEKFKNFGFENKIELLSKTDLPRGSGNNAVLWDTDFAEFQFKNSFYVVMKLSE